MRGGEGEGRGEEGRGGRGGVRGGEEGRGKERRGRKGGKRKERREEEGKERRGRKGGKRKGEKRREGGKRKGEMEGRRKERRREEKGIKMIHDSPLPSLDLCSSITHIVRLISVAMGTLADSIRPHPQPEGDIFLVLNNRRTMTSHVTMATYYYYKTPYIVALSYQSKVYLS